MTPDHKIDRCPHCGAAAELDTMQSYRMLVGGRIGTRVAINCTGCAADMGLCMEDVRDFTQEQVVASVVAAWNRRDSAQGKML